MTFRPQLICLLAAVALATILPPTAELSAADVNITAPTTRIIPIALKGYSREAQAVLEFDLSVAGFEVRSNDPQYTLTGSATGDLKGTLVDSGNNQTLFARVYPGGSVRSQAHTLADDVVKDITGLPGIARTKIAFKVASGQRNKLGQNISEIYVSDFDGENAAQVTEDNSIVAAPAWVPGNLRLFYASYRGGAGPAINSHDLRTGNRNVVAAYSGSNISPSVSPDGTKLAMILSKSGSPELWVANLDGTGLKQLTRTKGAEASPTWSPDSKTICYVSDDPGRPTLFTVSASGGEPSRLKVGGVVHCTEPDWSPDGRSIAFTRSAGEFTIYVVPASGGNAEAVAPGEDPSWAPNSRTLVFTRGRGGSRKLSLLDVPTRRVKDVAKVSGNCSQPSWARRFAP
jgi:TolB protein